MGRVPDTKHGGEELKKSLKNAIYKFLHPWCPREYSYCTVEL